MELLKRVKFPAPPDPVPEPVLLGTDYWTDRLPVWSVLDALSRDRGYRDLIVLTDDEHHAIETIRSHHR